MRSFVLVLFALFVSSALSVENGTRRTVRRVADSGARFSSSFRNSEYTRAAKAYIVEHATRWNRIINPAFPQKYKGINYYWYGTYSYDASHPLKCEYTIEYSDRELINITMPDGAKPLAIQYGCLTYQDCCGLECCGDSRSSTFIICGTFCIFLGVYTVFSKCSKDNQSLTSEEETPVVPKNRKPKFETHSV